MEWNVAKINIFRWFFTIFWSWYDHIVKSMQVSITTMLHLIKHIFMFITKEKWGLLDLFGASLLMFVENGNIFHFSKDFFSLIQFFSYDSKLCRHHNIHFRSRNKISFKMRYVVFCSTLGRGSSPKVAHCCSTIGPAQR